MTCPNCPQRLRLRTLALAGLALAAAGALAASLAIAPGCRTAQHGAQLGRMDGPELERFTTRLAAQVGILAAAALAEGSARPEELAAVAATLRRLAAHADPWDAAADAGLRELPLSGWGAAALALALIELDSALPRPEAGMDAWEQGRAALEAAAAALEAAAAQGGQG
jgi:hypothetical protein